MNIEEYSIIGNCNGMFTEFYRPDLLESKTDDDIINNINLRITNKHNNITKSPDSTAHKSNEKTIDSHIIIHNLNSYNCKNSNKIKLKLANYDFFKTIIHTCTRRPNFHLVTNTSTITRSDYFLNQTAGARISSGRRARQPTDLSHRVWCTRTSFHDKVSSSGG